MVKQESHEERRRQPLTSPSRNGDSSSPGKGEVHFKRVQPRIGSQFQTKVPIAKQHDNLLQSSSTRPLPERMSKERPFLTDQEAYTIGEKRKRASWSTAAETKGRDRGVAVPGSSPSFDRSRPRSSSRGGVCVHYARHDDNDDTRTTVDDSSFLLFCRQLMLPQQRNDNNDVNKDDHAFVSEQELWKQDMIQRYAASPPTASRRGKNSRGRARSKRAGGDAKQRGAKKRKLVNNKDDDEDEVAASATSTSDEDVTTTTTPARQQRRTTTTTTTALENDEHMLDYLYSQHDGNVPAAQLSILVHLSSGGATKARKCLRKKLHVDRFKQPPIDSSLSWKARYERTFPIMLGDYRTDPSQPSIYYDDSSCKNSTTSSSSCLDAEQDAASQTSFTSTRTGALSSSDAAVMMEDMKGVWRSVLACGQAMERVMSDYSENNNNNNNSSKRPSMSEVSTFVGNAHALHTPEECFGTRHIVVERISQCIHGILDQVSSTRNVQAKLMDKLHDEDGEGIDLEALAKFMDELDRTVPIQLDELPVLYQHLEDAAQWQTRLDAIISSGNNNIEDAAATSSTAGVDTDNVNIVVEDNLTAAEQLALEGKTLGLRPRNHVLLEKKIEKAHLLRDRIHEWNEAQRQGKKDSIKHVASMVREANRLDLTFPEVSKLKSFHRLVEAWIDRANIAIRSRISLAEIETLIARGDATPIDLEEYLEKLRSRVRLAHEWIQRFQKHVPCPHVDSLDGVTNKVDNLEWMARMREALRSVEKNGPCSVLLDLASEGSRIPVEIDCVKMLQLEIDAKNWSLKGKKWLPPTENRADDMELSTTNKRGKLEDLREHVEKAALLHERHVLPSEEKAAWTLEGEAELKAILEAADNWFDEYRQYLDGDNRRNEARSCIAVPKLRQIVEEANLIYANLGSASTKIARILTQAKTWYEKHHGLLDRCGICGSEDTVHSFPLTKPKRLVSLSEMITAVEEASSTVSLDLEEALALEQLSERVQKWFDRALLAAPKRSKRNVRGKPMKTRYSLEDVIELIEESLSLPVDTEEDVERLKIQLSVVQSWRLQAQCELGEIASAFCKLREDVRSAYGLPEEFFKEEMEVGMPAEECMNGISSSEEVSKADLSMECSENLDVESVSEDVSPSDSASSAESETEPGVSQRLNGGGSRVHKLIASLMKNAKAMGIYTAEERVAEVVERASKWFARSLKYLDSPRDAFEKKSFVGFDKFIRSGEDLVALSRDVDNEIGCKLDDVELLHSLNSSWGSLLADQLVRLHALQFHRDKFIAWCNNAEQLLSSTDKKVSLETLLTLAEQSSRYPVATPTVYKVKNLATKATSWAKAVDELLDSDRKLSMQDAKDIFDEGDKLNVSCSQLKVMRNALRSARGWAARVKRSKLDQGGTHVGDLQELVEEHNYLLVVMPDVVKKLEQAMRGYCICRRPYEGFMIGCDTCEEWYHGPCIGVSESQADRFDKYVCIRCCVTRVFKISSSCIVSAMRKWMSPKDLKKARQIDWQKHQRKVRKENRDIEKLEPEIECLEKELEALRNKGLVPICSDTTDCLDIETKNATSALDSAVVDSPSLVTTVCETEKQVSKSVSAGKGAVGCAPDIPSSESLGPETERTDGPETDNGAHGKETRADAPLNSDGEKEEVLTDAGKPLHSDKDEEKVPTTEDIEAKLKKATAALQHCHNRLEMLSKQASERREEESKEDEKSYSLQRWCVRLGLSVLFPLTAEQALRSRPHSDGSLSAPMTARIEEAESLGIAQLPDISLVTNSLRCISWSFHALTVLARKPTIAEVHCLVSQPTLKLPEEKSLRMMKSMIQRASLWQGKVAKALAPRPGETRSYCLDTLKELAGGADDIPMELPEESRLLNAIDDNGKRHCICGGPSDGTFMLGCDKCQRWFHGRCVAIDKDAGDSLSSWVCPPCIGVIPPEQPSVACGQLRNEELVQDAGDGDSDEDIAPHAPKPSQMWPPYGLLKSSKALEVLGEECAAFVEEAVRLSSTGGAETINENLSTEKEASESTCEKRKDDVENKPLVVSPELPATEVDIVDGNDTKIISADPSAGVVRNDCTTTSLDGLDLNAASKGNDHDSTAEKLQIPAVKPDNVNSDGQAIDGGLPVCAEVSESMGSVAETSVGSVEESDPPCPLHHSNWTATSDTSLPAPVEDSRPPIAANVVNDPALPTIVHRHKSALSTADDSNVAPEAEDQPVVQAMAPRDLSSLHTNFANVSEVVPLACMKENTTSVP